MTLPVTAFVAAVCALLLLVTAIDTVRQRLRLSAAFGDHGDAKLISASRAHGNLAEYAPITITRANHMALMVIGAIFLIGRVGHIIGLYTPSKPGKAPLGRQVGVVATFGVLAALSLWTLWVLVTQNL